MIINFNKKLFNKKYIIKIQEAYSNAIKILNLPSSDLEINIDFVSEEKIRELNKEFRNKDTKTDVLSFPALLEYGVTDMQLLGDKLIKDNFPNDFNPVTNCLFVGDICICKSVALRNAKEYGTNNIREIVYMAVHGLLHLIGYDHMKDYDKKIMREAEEKIMKSINLERK